MSHLRIVRKMLVVVFYQMLSLCTLLRCDCSSEFQRNGLLLHLKSSRRDLQNALLCTALKSHFFQNLREFKLNSPQQRLVRNRQVSSVIWNETKERKAWAKARTLGLVSLHCYSLCDRYKFFARTEKYLQNLLSNQSTPKVINTALSTAASTALKVSV